MSTTHYYSVNGRMVPPEEYARQSAPALTAALARAERAEATLAALRAYHASWGDTDGDDLDQLALWEDVGRLLRGVST